MKLEALPELKLKGRFAGGKKQSASPEEDQNEQRTMESEADNYNPLNPPLVLG